MKTCPKCGGYGPFGKDTSRTDGLTSWCKACNSANHKKFYNDPEFRLKTDMRKIKWAEGHKVHVAELQRRNHLKRMYGISVEEWELKLSKQGNCCAICKVVNPGGSGWHTDHDHTTNKIRGILCSNCNRALGHFKDSILILESAISYLTRNVG